MLFSYDKDTSKIELENRKQKEIDTETSKKQNQKIEREIDWEKVMLERMPAEIH